MRKEEFVQDAIVISGDRRSAYWSAQYDAMALGYQGSEINLIACALAEDVTLERPAETLCVILRRIQDEE